MTGTVWSKFFWSDWAEDPALRMCSFAAQGLWMRMLCIAAGHVPIGYVAVAGRGLEIPDLARVIGGDESEVRALLGELDRNGVFSRDRSGRIFCRRMVRDAKKAATARKNGKLGGNPNLRKQKENQPLDKPPDNLSPGIWNNTSSSLLPELEKEKKESEVVPIRARARADWPPGAFGEFWAAYPHKVGKQAASRAFEVVRKSASAPPWSEFMSGLRRYISNKPPTRDWCHPTTWLNQGRWEDQPAAVNGQNHAAPRPGSKEDQRERTANAYRKLDEYLDARTNDPRRSGEASEAPTGLLPFAKPP